MVTSQKCQFAHSQFGHTNINTHLVTAIWSHSKMCSLVTAIWSHSRNVQFGHSQFGHKCEMVNLVTANLVTGVKWYIWSQLIWSQR